MVASCMERAVWWSRWPTGFSWRAPLPGGNVWRFRRRGAQTLPDGAQHCSARQAEMSDRQYVCPLRRHKDGLRNAAFILCAGGVVHTGEMALQVAGLGGLAPARGWAACGRAEALLRGIRARLLRAAGRKTGRGPMGGLTSHCHDRSGVQGYSQLPPGCPQASSLQNWAARRTDPCAS